MCRRNVGIVHVCTQLQSSLCEDSRSGFFKVDSHSDDPGPSPNKFESNINISGVSNVDSDVVLFDTNVVT